MSSGSKHSSPRSRFDEMREEAFTKSHRHRLELQFGRERRSSGVLPVIAGGIVAAIGVTVVAALVFFQRGSDVEKRSLARRFHFHASISCGGSRGTRRPPDATAKVR